MTDDDERRYLRRATRGLWGRRRRDLEAELRGHLDARRRELALWGLSEAEATARALSELGEPRRVSRGMAQVYLLPGLARGAALSVMLSGAAFLAVSDLSHGLAQVGGYQPVYALPGGPFTYLDLGSLQAELTRAGVGVAGLPVRPVLTFPGRAAPVVVETGAAQGELEPFLRRALVRDYGSGRVYLDAGTLARSLVDAGLDVRVTGGATPSCGWGAWPCGWAPPRSPWTPTTSTAWG